MTRQEAINKIYGMSGTKEQHEALDFLIPELRELREFYERQQEDERIRKWIVKFLVEQYPECWKDKKNKMLAYLEKQKEQKSADEQFPPLEGLDKIKAKYYDDGFKNGFDEGAESVKSAEWSEEDEKMLQSIIKDFRAGKVSTIGQEQWLKFLPKRFNLQPKQEWSEEDRHAIENCEYAIKETFKDEQNPHRIGTLDWLKSLKPQPKQEWSEEDEHRRTDAIYFLESAKSHYADTSEIEKTIGWLKSLRPQPKRNCKDCAMFLNGKCTKPHWKPSDEQMNSLCATIVQTKGYSYSAYLPELYEQLKKL